MEEIDKRIFTLKRAIRMAINESGLSMVIAENILDSIKAEIIQQEYYALASGILNADPGETNDSTNTKEEETNGRADL